MATGGSVIIELGHELGVRFIHTNKLLVGGPKGINWLMTKPLFHARLTPFAGALREFSLHQELFVKPNFIGSTLLPILCL